ncbi:hypothetical protein [Vallitalea sp.]|jgi:hypothetical protein|uniref:hypothetical protein n=1 Tax=Vallitalea sp. TaxID=1882829 RepID=UPI0025DD7505|nr:hypothetical protein [Vallitalea sp.]MCT4688627.1 hypothetical protein [Vallitalea sp.]
MGKLCRKYITISGILLIYAICIPSAFISHAQIIKVQNNYNMPIRANGQWNLEKVLNGTVFKEIENTIDNRLNKKDKFLRLYSLIQKYLNNKIENSRLMCDKEYTNTYKPVLIDNNIKSNIITEDTNDKLIQMPITYYIDSNSTLEEYFRVNYKLNTNGKYIEYKVILSRMNIKYTSTESTI